MKKWTKGKRGLACLLSAAMAVTLMPAVVSADSTGETGNYNNGTYEATSINGWGGSTYPVKVSVTIQDGKITELTSPEHAGESFWDSRNVDLLLQRIVETDHNIEAVLKGLNTEGGIDAISSTTEAIAAPYSS